MGHRFTFAPRAAWVAPLLAAGLAVAKPPAGAADLVDIATVAPAIQLDIRYATPRNFTAQTIYPAARCLLRREVARRLARVQVALQANRLGLKVFDCYRPLSAQRKLWSIVADERYVANPAKGSRHNRAAAVDLTLVSSSGEELDMGTAYDDFSERAHRDYRALPRAVLEHRGQLEQAMAREGFVGLPTEWWHFDGPGWQRYPILDVDFDRLPPVGR